MALGTPPAKESWWRNPVVVVATVVSVVAGGGVASWRFFLASGADAPLVRIVRQPSPVRAHPSAPQVPDAGSPSADVERWVRDLGRVLVRSEAGRAAALQQRDYAAALRNRSAIVSELDGLGAPTQPARLAAAYTTLGAAMRASARADEEHLACGCDALQPGDVEAQRLKREFATLFAPFAQRYLGHAVDPDRI